MNLSDRVIAALPTPSRGQKLYVDRDIPGFGIRVSQGGAKSFVLTIGANRQRITLGRYPIVTLAQARDHARTILAERQLGIAHPVSPSFRQVLEEFLEGRQDRRPNTRRKDAQYARRFNFNKRICEITAAEAERAVSSINGSVMRSQGRIWLRSLFLFAEERSYIQRSPLVRLRKTRKLETEQRVLTHAELRRVLQVARDWQASGHRFGAMLELLALTGQRRHQISAVTRDMIHFETGTIAWPATCMKNGRRHEIPMGEMTRAILERYRARAGLLFPSASGHPFSAWSTFFNRFRDECGFQDWTLHSLRRTMATRWQELGIEIATTEKMLSHSAITGGLVGIYQRSSYLTQMRKAVRQWETYLDNLVRAPDESMNTTALAEAGHPYSVGTEAPLNQP